MNVIEILLKEASIFTRAGAYTYGHMVRVSAGSKIGGNLLTRIQAVVKDFDPEEKLEWVANPVGASSKVQTGTGTDKLHFKRPNGTGITIIGTPSAVEKGLLHADRFNRGDIAEAILGASLTAKLIKRGTDRIGDINENDVKSVLRKTIAKPDGSLTLEVDDRNSQIADKIKFTLRLPSGSMIAIKNPKLWDKFDDLFASGVEYCNDTDAEKYSNHFYKNGKVDEVFITSDGVSDQKGRKTDVQAVVRDPATGKVRDLRNVDISLKADSNIYGQQGTGGLQAGKAVWLEKANAMFSPLGVVISMPTRHTDIVDFWRQVYKQATKQLNSFFAKDTANQETVFVQKVADLINKHGSGNNRNLRLLSFEKGTYSIHSFNMLKQRLVANNIDFMAEMSIGPRSGKPSIEISDRNSGQVLTAIRYFQGGDKSSNYFEKGPLLHELTRITKTKAPATQPATPADTAPASPASAPTDSASFSPAKKISTKKVGKDLRTTNEPSLSIAGSQSADNLDPNKNITV